VFENRAFRRIFGTKRDEETGEWRKLHNEELHNLYSSPSIIRIIKSRSMRWAVHVARMGEKRNAYRILVGTFRKSCTVIAYRAAFTNEGKFRLVSLFGSAC
jgi:hypothetical protein